MGLVSEPVNPGGNMGYGASIYEGEGASKKLLFEYSDFDPAHPDNTNNVAEYKAMNWILETLIAKNLQDQEIKIYGDSQLVIKQLWVPPPGEVKFTIRQGKYVPFARHALSLLPKFSRLSFVWVPREKNAHADSLSKAQLLKHHVKIANR